MGVRKNPNNMNQKIFIKTFGCQMNEYDSNRIYDSVKKIGYEKTEKYEEANCYLLNFFNYKFDNFTSFHIN